jgi:FkbM family methyltransferase
MKDNALPSSACEQPRARVNTEALHRIDRIGGGFDGRTLRDLGIALMRTHKTKEAIACLETAYAFDETDYATGEWLIHAYDQAGAHLDAAEISKQRLRYFPNDQRTIRHMLEFYQQDDTIEKKIESIRAFVRKRVPEAKGQRILFGMSFAIYPPCRVHDFLLSQALALRGAQILPLACGMAQEGECNVFGGIWAGMTGKADLDHQKCQENCRACVAADNMLWRKWGGRDPLAVRDFISSPQREKCRQLAAQMDLSRYRELTADGMPIGRWAVDVIRNNYLVADETLVPDLLSKLRSCLFNILTMIEGCRSALLEIRPDIVVSNDSFYYQWAVLEELAKRSRIPFYSHWSATRRMGWCYAYNEPAMELNLSRQWPSFISRDLKAFEARIVDDFLKERPSGSSMTLNTADPNQNSTRCIQEEIDFSKPSVLLAANVIWDLAALNRDVQFRDMVDWVCRTIEFFRGYPDWQLIIKPHPGEFNQHLPPTRQLLAEEIAKRIPKLPANVVVCSPLTQLSVYDIIPRVRFGLVFTSTVGLEMACRGMAVVTSGASVYRGKGFTYDPPTADEYFAALSMLMKVERITAPSPQRALLARKFLYLYLFRYYVGLNLFDHSYAGQPVMLIHHPRELLPGANDVLDYVCDSILGHHPIVSTERLPPLARTLRGLYSFTPSEAVAGSRLMMSGYPTLLSEQTTDETGDLASITLEGDLYRFPTRMFKAGELSWIFQEVCVPPGQNPHAYENDFVSIRPGDVVLDAGACVGFFTRRALARGADRVYAIEPHPGVAKGMRETFRSECAAGSVVISTVALTCRNGTVRFADGGNSACEARMSPQGTLTVSATTLDDFVVSHRIERIDFIKMDIEGEEMNALSGAIRTINRDKPRLSIAVYHQYENASLVRDILMANCPGYQVVFGGRYMFEVPHRPFMAYAKFCGNDSFQAGIGTGHPAS